MMNIIIGNENLWFNPWPYTQSIANTAITSNDHYKDDADDDNHHQYYQW